MLNLVCVKGLQIETNTSSMNFWRWKVWRFWWYPVYICGNHKDTNVAFLKAESSDWQGAHPGRVPIRKCGDESLPFEAQGLGWVVRGQAEESHLAGWEEDGPGNFQRCLNVQKSKYKNNWLNRSFLSPFLSVLLLLLWNLPPLSSVPGGGAQDAGGARAGPSL